MRRKLLCSGAMFPAINYAESARINKKNTAFSDPAWWGPAFGVSAIYPFPKDDDALIPWSEVDVVFDMTESQPVRVGIKIN